jgi:hypothetical protein
MFAHHPPPSIPRSPGTVKAIPYKLLLYEAGDFFLPHRDTEKEPGMFATLVLQLPSTYTGGALVVRHGGKVGPSLFLTLSHSTRCLTPGFVLGGGAVLVVAVVVVVSMRHTTNLALGAHMDRPLGMWWVSPSPTQVEEYLAGHAAASTVSHFAVHFADVEHEVQPITSGCRLVVVYNLVWTGSAAQAPSTTSQVCGGSDGWVMFGSPRSWSCDRFGCWVTWMLRLLLTRRLLTSGSLEPCCTAGVLLPPSPSLCSWSTCECGARMCRRASCPPPRPPS